MDQRRIRVAEQESLVCRRLTEEILSTQNYLREDLQWISGVVCGSFGSLQDPKNRDTYCNFLLRTNHNRVGGRYSFTYSHYLRLAIENRNSTEVLRLVSLPKGETMVEIFDNPSLSAEEVRSIFQMLEREYIALQNTLEKLLSMSSEELTHFLSGYNLCGIEKITVATRGSLDGKRSVSSEVNLFDRCHKNVCLLEASSNSKKLEDRTTAGVTSILLSRTRIPEFVYVPKFNEEGDPECYWMEYIQVIDSLARGIPVTPSELGNYLLLEYYRTDILVYSRYLSELS